MPLSSKETKAVLEYIEDIEHDFSIIKEKFIDKEKEEVKSISRLNRRLEILIGDIKKILEITNPDFYLNSFDSQSYFSKSQKSVSNFRKTSEAQNSNFGGEKSLEDVYEVIFTHILKRENRICNYQNKKKNEIIDFVEEEKKNFKKSFEKRIEEEFKKLDENDKDINENYEVLLEISDAVKAQMMGVKANEVSYTQKIAQKFGDVDQRIIDVKEKLVDYTKNELKKKIRLINQINNNLLNENLSLKESHHQRSVRESIKSSNFPSQLRIKFSIFSYPLPKKYQEKGDGILEFSSSCNFLFAKRNIGFVLFENMFPTKFNKIIENCNYFF